MAEFWGGLISRRFRAFFGTAIIHAAMIGLFLSWQPRPLPEAPETIPIILVEIPVAEPDRPVEAETPASAIETDPIVEPEETADSSVPPPDGQSATVETTPQPQPIEPEEEEQRPEVFEEDTSAPAPSVSVAPSLEIVSTNPADEEVLATDINPDYVYKFDPFAETAPTPLARVVRAANCSRVNRETRMPFCPNYDENDIFLAATNTGLQSRWGQADYDPIGDIAVAKSSIGAFGDKAAYQNYAEGFRSGQVKPQFRGSSELHRVNFDDPVVPDENCRAIPFGFSGPAAGTLDSNVAPSDSKAVHCW